MDTGNLWVQDMSGYRKYVDMGNVWIWEISGYGKCRVWEM